MLIRRNDLIHTGVLLLGMLGSGIAALLIGKELNWDLASYHFYNPYAFIYARAALDHWPAEFLHVHLTPTADFLTYYLITFYYPATAVFILGAVHGINFWLLYGIAGEMMSAVRQVKYPRLLSLLLAYLGMYGPTVIPGLGSFSHDALVSLFVLSFVWIFLRASREYFSARTLFMAGLLLGVAAGLKLTAGVFVISALLSIMVVDITYRQQARVMLLLIAGVTVGIVLTSGYWMMLQWQQYHNPVYPFMNAVFQSPDFPLYNWSDNRFMPTSFIQSLFYPFYFSFDGQSSDVPFRDFRFAIAYLLIFVLLLRRASLKPAAKWLLVFFVWSYVVWQVGFSIMRYAMPLEMLAPIIVFLLIDALTGELLVRAGLVLVFALFTYLSMLPARTVRAPWYNGDYFNVNIPPMATHTPHAMVLMPFSAYALALKPRPQTYLVAFLPEKWRYQGVPFHNGNFTLTASIAEQVDQFSGRIFLLTSSEYLPQMLKAGQALGLVSDGECAEIKSDRQKISDEDVKLCPVKKASSASRLL